MADPDHADGRPSLDHLFDDRRSYTIDDFSEFYRTKLNILGQPTDETVQECAVLSRLIYGLSSAYLMTGAERYFLAALAAATTCARRSAASATTADTASGLTAADELAGRARRNRIFASQGPDDEGTIPLYEQIYALAGLTQFYRITLDWEVLDDIRRTVSTFEEFFWDPPSSQGRERRQGRFAGEGGYYSHLDPATMRPDTSTAGGEPRRRRTGTRSATTSRPTSINLILSLDPLPQGEVAADARAAARGLPWHPRGDLRR